MASFTPAFLFLSLGPNCQTNINECASNPCLNQGTCIDDVAGYTCNCLLPYTGEGAAPRAPLLTAPPPRATAQLEETPRSFGKQPGRASSFLLLLLLGTEVVAGARPQPSPRASPPGTLPAAWGGPVCSPAPVPLLEKARRGRGPGGFC